ncbi:MAG: hypothetical protein HZA91_06680 [Verrucomicrobia bacterium]|nr:hypothetical protein [Verrucomicrobiota bacterium]
MSILIKSKNTYYEIPATVLKKYKITKKQFEKGSKKAPADVAGQICMSKKSLWASCL